MKEWLEVVVHGVPITPSVLQVQEKVECTAELSGTLATQKIYDLNLVAVEQQKRDKRSNNKIVQNYGEIDVYQGRADIETDDEGEAKVINIRNARLAKPWRKEYKKMIQSFPEEYLKVLNCIRHRNHRLWERQVALVLGSHLRGNFRKWYAISGLACDKRFQGLAGAQRQKKK